MKIAWRQQTADSLGQSEALAENQQKSKTLIEARILSGFFVLFS